MKRLLTLSATSLALALVLLVPSTGQAASWYYSTTWKNPMLCADRGWTFPGLIGGDKPLRFCMIWAPVGITKDVLGTPEHLGVPRTSSSETLREAAASSRMRQKVRQPPRR